MASCTIDENNLKNEEKKKIDYLADDCGCRRKIFNQISESNDSDIYKPEKEESVLNSELTNNWWEDYPNRKAESLLKLSGAIATPLGSNDLSYELYFIDDQFSIYSDGSFYCYQRSETFEWEYKEKGDKIILYNGRNKSNALPCIEIRRKNNNDVEVIETDLNKSMRGYAKNKIPPFLVSFCQCVCEETERLGDMNAAERECQSIKTSLSKTDIPLGIFKVYFDNKHIYHVI